MSLSNEIVLRPRFEAVLEAPVARVLEQLCAQTEPPFEIKRSDNHVFVRFLKEETHLWSPQLHLELLDEEEFGGKPGTTRISGLFGPNPTLWTFFMFLHFGIATLFVIFGIWAYSAASLGRPYGIQVGIMVLMVVLWIVFYFLGRAGKAKGKPQMNALYDLYKSRIAGFTAVNTRSA